MSTLWKLNGTAAAALGVSRITRNRQSQKSDECTLTAALPFDAADLFAHGATVVLTRNDGAGDVPYFVGRCERDDRVGAPDGEHHTIKLLENFLRERGHPYMTPSFWGMTTPPKSRSPAAARYAI